MNRLLFLLTLCCISSMLMDDVFATETEVAVKEYRNLEFAEVDGTSLKLDLTVPESAIEPPLFVWVHGGGWRAGSKSKSPLKKLTQHGFAVASISYRFTDQAIFPAQIHDCKAAIRWLRAHASEYGYVANWIAVGGSSAGGHLALLLGTSGEVAELEGTIGGHLDQSSTVQAVVDFFGPSDFELRGKTHPERAYTTKSGSFALLGGLKYGKVDLKLQTAASPTTHITADDPPLLVFHGDKDQTVLLDQSEHIVKEYGDAGLAAKLIILEGSGHGGKTFFNEQRFQQTLSFLNQHRPASE